MLELTYVNIISLFLGYYKKKYKKTKKNFFKKYFSSILKLKLWKKKKNILFEKIDFCIKYLYINVKKFYKKNYFCYKKLYKIFRCFIYDKKMIKTKKYSFYLAKKYFYKQIIFRVFLFIENMFFTKIYFVF